MPQIDPLLSEVLEKRGSDLHFIAGDPPRIRLYGDISPLRPDKLAAEFVKQALYEIMPKAALDRFEAKDGADFAYTLPEQGPLPRQRHAPAERHGRGVPRHPLQGAHARGAEAPGGGAADVPRQQRADPGHRQDRLGQVDHARGDDRRHQPAREGPHPHDRGPDRVRARAEELPHQPARDRRALARPSPRHCTRPCARIRT